MLCVIHTVHIHIYTTIINGVKCLTICLIAEASPVVTPGLRNKTSPEDQVSQAIASFVCT